MSNQINHPFIDAASAESLKSLAKAVSRAQFEAQADKSSWGISVERKLREELTQAMPLDVADAVVAAPGEFALSDLLGEGVCGIGWDPIIRSAERVTGTAARIMVSRLKENWKFDPHEFSLSDIVAENPERYAPYEDELHALEAAELARLKVIQDERDAAEAKRLAARADELGCTVALLRYIESLERRIDT